MAVVGARARDRVPDHVRETTGKTMSRLMTALMVAAGLGIAGSASAQMTSPMSPSMPMSKDAHTTAM
jgi:hypothetical protein